MAFLFRSKSDRNEQRVQVVPAEIRGLLSGKASADQQPFLIWDVSENGVGVWVSEALPEESEVVLTIGQPYLLVVRCVVKWCESQGEDQGFRCGLRSVEKKKVFSALLAAFLKSKGG